MRTLVVHQAEGFRERGMSLSFGWDATPSSPLGLAARVAPSWGGQAQGGAEALWGNQMTYGMGSQQMYGAGGQLNAEVATGCRWARAPRLARGGPLAQARDEPLRSPRCRERRHLARTAPVGETDVDGVLPAGRPPDRDPTSDSA